MNTNEWNPGQLLEMSGNYWKTFTLHAGIKLDVFTAIGNDQLTSEDLASKLNVDKRGLTMLLNALAAMKLMKKSGDKYSNTSAGTSFLSKKSSGYIGHIITHHHHLVASWHHLDQAVKTGDPVNIEQFFSDEEMRESFLMGMFNMAMDLAPRLVKEFNLSDRHHLLDLGGGPGTYAIHFCLNNPQLKATVYDLSTTRTYALKTIEKFGLTHRIDFMEGDYGEESSIKGVYDVAWLSHILHGEGPEDCQKIIRKTVSALKPGGMIIIHDFILNNTMDGPLFPALFSLNMLLNTASGQSYSEKQITDLLAKGGVREIQRIPFKSPNDSGIITGMI